MSKVNLTPPAKVKKYDHDAFLKALRQLQATKSFQAIKDPAAWQREIRQDRPLPGRE